MGLRDASASKNDDHRISAMIIVGVIVKRRKKLEFLLQPTATRQAMFRQTKHFKCACKRCIEIWLLSIMLICLTFIYFLCISNRYI